jgi:hypothetical protein
VRKRKSARDGQRSQDRIQKAAAASGENGSQAPRQDRNEKMSAYWKHGSQGVPHGGNLPLKFAEGDPFSENGVSVHSISKFEEEK